MSYRRRKRGEGSGGGAEANVSPITLERDYISFVPPTVISFNVFVTSQIYQVEGLYDNICTSYFI